MTEDPLLRTQVEGFLVLLASCIKQSFLFFPFFFKTSQKLLQKDQELGFKANCWCRYNIHENQFEWEVAACLPLEVHYIIHVNTILKADELPTDQKQLL